MRKLLLLLVLSCFCRAGFAQSTTAATYALATIPGTYASITGTTVASLAADDAVATGINIGFTFRYCGVNYTTCAINTNGYISLANSGTTGATSYTNSQASLTGIGAGRGMLMPFWDDINGAAAGGTSTSCTGVLVRYTTSGTTPNRVFTVEWFNFGAYQGGATPTAAGCGSIQVKLYETTNAIEFWYSSSTFANMSATIGIANSNTDFKVISSAVPFPPFSTATFNTAQTTTLATGMVYRFCPQNIVTTASNGGPYCAGSTAAFTGTATGSTGLSYTWSGPASFATTVQNATIPSVTTTAAGTYTFTATLGTCYANDTSRLTVNPTPVVTGVDSLCMGTTATMVSSLTGGTWSSSATGVATVSNAGVLTPVSAGLANISYTMTATGCAGFKQIKVNPIPTVTPTAGAANVCQFATTTFTNATTGGVWSTANAAVATVNATGDVYGVAAGTTSISYTVTNSFGCSNTVSRSITVINFSLGSITGASRVCVGNTTTLSNSVSGGTWSTSNATIASVNTTGVVRGVAAGSATITYNLTNACGSIDSTFAITVETVPTVAAISGAVTTFCEGTSASFTDATSGGVWSSGNTGIATVDASGNVTGVSGGSTVISYTVSNSCGPVSSTIGVTINPLPDAGSITGVTTVCVGANTTLSDAAGGGVWSSSDNTVATVDASGVVTGVAGGSATISYTVTNGCGVDFATASVTVNPIPVAGTITGADSVCLGSATTLTDTTSGGSWSTTSVTIATVDGTGSVTGLGLGTASITYTVNTSCGTASTTKNVTVYTVPSPGTISGSSTVCETATITLTESVSGGTWSSSNPAVATVSTSGAVTGVSASTVDISYSVANACGSASTSTTITVDPAPVAGSISGVDSACVGASEALTDVVTGGTWTTASSAIATIDGSGVVTGISAGTTIISYNITTVCGTIADTMRFRVLDVITPSAIAGTTTFCVATTSTLSSTPAGGTWVSSDPSVATVSTTGVVTGVAIGSATISYSIINSCGTGTTSTGVTITTVPGTGFILGAPALCIGSSNTYTETTSGGTWSSSNPSVATISSGGIATGVASGTAVISYNTTNACGTTSDTLSVAVLAGSSAGVITGSPMLCVGSATVLANGIAGGTWSSSNPSIVTINPTFGLALGVSAGSATISYTVTDACGTISTTFAMRVDASVSAGTITGPSALCFGSGPVTLVDATTGGIWSSSDSTIARVSASGVVNGLTPGSATISYSVTNGCGTDVATHPVSIDVFPNAGVIVGPSTICASIPTTYTDTAVGGVWSSSNPSVATVNTSGVVTGLTAGFVNIYYAVSNTCGSTNVTISLTITPGPGVGTITGPSTMCMGNSALFTDTASGGTGAWSSSNTSLATVDATGRVYAISNGTVTISYGVTNSCGTGYATSSLTISTPTSAGVVGDGTTICIGSTNVMTETVPGGVWSSSDASIATVSTTGVVTGLSGGTAYISYTVTGSCGLNSAFDTMIIRFPTNAGTISGATSVCIAGTTLLTDSTSGGVWSSSNTAVATVNTTGLVTGVSAGSATITYSVTDMCGTAYTTFNISSVNPATPASISGTTSVCQGATTSLTASIGGGVWSSADTTIATIGTTGVVSGITAGSAIISYTITNACGMAVATAFVTVNPLPLPGAITGPDTVCLAGTATVADTPAGGSWFSSNTAVASIDAAGNITPVTAGTTIISYSLTNGCGTTIATKTVTVGDLPATAGTISGTTALCPGTTVTLTNSVTGGVWSTSDVAVATIDASGNVTGVAAGLVSVSYTVSNICGSVSATDTLRVNTGSGSGDISAATTTMCVGIPLTLSDTVTGGIWSSGDTSIAVVDASGVVTGVAGGAVDISYTVSNSCGTNTSTIGLIYFPAPALSVIGGPAAVCEGTTATLTNSYFGGSWTSSNTSVASIDAATGDITGIAAGTTDITYTATNVYGCSAMVTRTDTVQPAPYAGVISAATTTFCAGTTLALSESVTGGVWSSSDASVATVDASGTVYGVSGGSVDISYTFTNSCGTDVTSATLLVNPLPTASAIIGPSTFCTGVPVTLSNTTFGGTWASSDTLVATIDPSTGDLVGVASGYVTISYTVSNVFGCSLTITANDTVNTSADAGAITTSTTTICEGQLLTLTESVTGGVWSSSDTTVLTVDTAGVVTAIMAGTATVSYSVSSSVGCPSAATAGFVVNPTPATPAAITGASSMCVGSSVTLTETTTGGFWSTADASVASVDASGVVTGVNPGVTTISYTVANAYGCSASATHTDTVSLVPLVTAIGGPTTICTGTAVTLTNGFAGGTWSSSDASVASIDAASGAVTGITAGNVTFTYTLATSGGCFTIITTDDTVALAPVVTAISGPGTLCTGTMVNLTNATTGGSWTSADTTIARVNTAGDVTGIAAGTTTISYTVANAAGCSTSVTASISVDPLPGISPIAGGSNACLGAGITLTDTATGGVWSTSNSAVASVNATTGMVTGVSLDTATITYTVISSSGCVNSASQLVTVNALPAVPAITGAALVCENAAITLSNDSTGGAWASSSTANATVNASTGVVTGVGAGAATISYTYTAATGCSATVTSGITVNAAPVVGAITGTTTLCLGTAVTYTDTTAGGTWSSSAATIATVSVSGTVTPVTTGSATISYSVTNGSGCTTHATLAVTVGALPVVATITGATSVCANGTITLADTTTGGTWSSSSSTIASVGTTGIVYGTSAGSATISYTVTNAAGCSTSVTATVTVNPIPAAGSITGASSVCLGNTTTLSNAVTGGSWSSSDTTIATVSASGVVTGVATGSATITYTVANSFGCTNTVTTSISVNNAPSGVLLPVSGGITLCDGNPVILSVAAAAGSAGFQWFINGSAIAGATNATYNTDSFGFYSVQVSDGGCSILLSGVTVSLPPTPVITRGAGNLLFTGSYTSYQWFLNGSAIGGATSSVFVASVSGNYTVIVSDANGCSDTSAIYVFGGASGVGTQQIAAIKFYPNPATTSVIVDAPFKVNVSILSPDGKVVIHQDNAHELSLGDLANGMYLIMIYDEDNNLLRTDKFVKSE